MKTVADICARLDNERHLLHALEFAFPRFIKPDMEINDAIKRLDQMIVAETAKKDKRHWSYCMNRLIAMKQARVSLGVGLLAWSMQP